MEKTDLAYLQGVLSNDAPLLESIYRKFLPVVFGMVHRNCGTFEDAKDVFQEALLVVYKHAARPEFQLTSSFESYLLGIARFIWLRQLKKTSRTQVTNEVPERFDVAADIEQQVIETEKHTLYRDNLKQLGVDCQQLLQRFFNREPLNKIAGDMGYSPDYVKKKNKVCKEKLISLIQDDPRFNEIASRTSAV